MPDTIFTCKFSGYFKKGDFYCNRNGIYLWRCKNEKDCNKVKPLSELGSKMWETWELLPRKPGMYIEPSVNELNAMINAKPMKEEGY